MSESSDKRKCKKRRREEEEKGGGQPFHHTHVSPSHHTHSQARSRSVNMAHIPPKSHTRTASGRAHTPPPLASLGNLSPPAAHDSTATSLSSSVTSPSTPPSQQGGGCEELSPPPTSPGQKGGGGLSMPLVAGSMLSPQATAAMARHYQRRRAAQSSTALHSLQAAAQNSTDAHHHNQFQKEVMARAGIHERVTDDGYIECSAASEEEGEHWSLVPEYSCPFTAICEWSWRRRGKGTFAVQLKQHLDRVHKTTDINEMNPMSTYNIAQCCECGCFFTVTKSGHLHQHGCDKGARKSHHSSPQRARFCSRDG